VAHAVKASRYLAIHLRFEIDMLAHSLCEYGGGEEERKELEAYREIHFPALTHLKKTTEYAVLLLFPDIHVHLSCMLACIATCCKLNISCSR